MRIIAGIMVAVGATAALAAPVAGQPPSTLDLTVVTSCDENGPTVIGQGLAIRNGVHQLVYRDNLTGLPLQLAKASYKAGDMVNLRPDPAKYQLRAGTTMVFGITNQPSGYSDDVTVRWDVQRELTLPTCGEY